MTVTQDPELVPRTISTAPRFQIVARVDTLKAAVSAVAGVAPSNEVVPGTAHVLLTAMKDGLALTATDGHMSVSTSCTAKVKATGGVRVPPKKLLAVLDQAPDRLVMLAARGNRLAVISGNSKWVLSVPPGDTLPKSPEVEKAKQECTLDASEFKDALRAVLPAASTLTARPGLMQVRVLKGNLTAVDGGRVHRVKVMDLDESLDFAIPVETAKELARLLKDGDLTIRVEERRMEFTMGKTVLSSAALLAPFPSIDALLLPATLKNTWNLKVERDELAGAVKRVCLNADPDFRTVSLTLDMGVLTVHAKDRDGNASKEAVEASWDGPEGARTWTFNYKHLLDFLNLGFNPAEWKVGKDEGQVLTSFLLDDSDVTGLLQQVRADVL